MQYGNFSRSLGRKRGCLAGIQFPLNHEGLSLVGEDAQDDPGAQDRTDQKNPIHAPLRSAFGGESVNSCRFQIHPSAPGMAVTERFE